MAWIIKKYLLTAGIVILVSELAKRSDMLGCLVAALSLVTVLTLVWLYLENQSMEKISNHAWYTFLYVLPTLPMFIAFPLLLPKESPNKPSVMRESPQHLIRAAHEPDELFRL